MPRELKLQEKVIPVLTVTDMDNNMSFGDLNNMSATDIKRSGSPMQSPTPRIIK